VSSFTAFSLHGRGSYETTQAKVSTPLEIVAFLPTFF
jgi:hypothetical protein